MTTMMTMIELIQKEVTCRPYRNACISSWIQTVCFREFSAQDNTEYTPPAAVLLYTTVSEER